jgi:hypothetical protein
MTTSISVAGEPKVLSDFELETITAAGSSLMSTPSLPHLGDSTRSLPTPTLLLSTAKAWTWAFASKNLGIGL